jgi:hypothetical protein
MLNLEGLPDDYTLSPETQESTTRSATRSDQSTNQPLKGLDEARARPRHRAHGSSQPGVHSIQKRTTPGFHPGLIIKSAITYFPAWQYHRRQELNFCVRDGNRCILLPIVTDKSDVGLSPDAGFVHVAMCFEQLQESFIEILACELDESSKRQGRPVDAIKPLTVSTG